MRGCIFFIRGFLLLLFIVVPGTVSWANPVNDSLKFEAYSFISKGNEAEFRNAYTEAEKKYLKALEIWSKIEEYDEYRAYPYFSLAILHQKMGDYQKSLSNFQKAEQILLTAREEYKFLLSAIYSNMGKLFVGYGDYTKSLLYFNKSSDVINSTKQRNESVYLNLQLNIAQAYFSQQKYQLAIDLCENYINSKNSIEHSRVERLIGSCLIAQGKYDDAKKILEQSLLGFNDQPEKYTEAFLITTKAYIRSGDLVTAEEYLKKAIPLLAANKPTMDPWNIYYYELRGEFLIKKAERAGPVDAKLTTLSEALKVIDKALLMNSATTEGSKIPYIDTEGKYINPTQVKDLLISRARVLKMISENYRAIKDQISERHFKTLALETWDATVRFLHDFRVSFIEEESKLSLSESQLNVYKEGYLLSRDLFTETGNEKYLEKMLFFSESGKSSTFLASLNAVQAKNFGGIPDSLLNKEKELDLQLSAMDQLIFNARKSEKPDSALLGEWEKNQFNIQKQHDELLFSFEREFPNYYKFKYTNQLISANEIRSKLGRKQALIEYFIDEPTNENDSGSVNILLFTKSGPQQFRKEIGCEYVKNLSAVLEELTNHNVGETNLNGYTNFMRSANYLNSVLIEPIGLSSSITDLIVIPDGKLAYLPFDALISNIPDSTRISFSSPEYLVKRFNFVYSYSATLHYDYFRNNPNTNSKIVAFAPDYSGGEFDLNKEAYRARQAERATLRPLPGAKEEVVGLSDRFKGKAFIGNSATEQKFKQEAGSYGILHLAMHTMMNDSIPMYSKLVFAPNTSDSLNDGFLNTQEIYNMKLNAKLAVLSACNTGSGKMRAGEGVMSLARAFLYAGCPSIVMTLWEVEDKSSAVLVLNFYKYLFRGFTKPEALQLAKLDYLSEADPLKSHPYFWMGYIVVGDPSPIKYHTTVIIAILIFALVVTVILLLGKRIVPLLWGKEPRRNTRK
jgi:CHAT domain-containing protein/predicted negative regulator of RcsB-dependent stress response